jgi:uncharacterized membrane protein
MMHPFYGFNWLAMLIPLVVVGVFFLALVALIVWAVRRTSGPHAVNPQPGGPVSASSALEVVRMRYAKGEINREEYQQLLDDLNKG